MLFCHIVELHRRRRLNSAEGKASISLHVRSAGAQQQHHAGSRPVGYGLFGCTVEQVRQRVQPDVIAEHAGFFKVAGIIQLQL